MRRHLRALIAALLLTAPHAHAADTPRYLPGRDVAVVYHVLDAPAGAPAQITLRYFAVADRLRLDAGQGPYLLIDRTVERIEMIIPSAHMFLELPKGGGIAQGFVLGDQLHLKRTAATQRILGRSCTVHDVTLEADHATACLSADGLVLAGQGRLPDGRAARIEAVSISFAPQIPGMFSPPDTYRMIGGTP